MAHEDSGFTLQEASYALVQMGYNNPTQYEICRYFYKRQGYFYYKEWYEPEPRPLDRSDYRISLFREVYHNHSATLLKRLVASQLPTSNGGEFSFYRKTFEK